MNYEAKIWIASAVIALPLAIVIEHYGTYEPAAPVIIPQRVMVVLLLEMILTPTLALFGGVIGVVFDRRAK